MRKIISFKTLFHALAIAALLLDTGCGAILQTRKTTIITAQDSTHLFMKSRPYGSTYSVQPVFPDDKDLIAPGQATVVPISNKINSYAITESKKGYLPYTMPMPRKFNTAKLGDIGLSIIGDCVLLADIQGNSSQNSSSAQSGPSVPAPILYPCFYWGTWGWIDMLIGPWHVYSKSYTLPPLVKIPYRTPDENKLYIKNVSVNIKKDNLQVKYYSSFTDYQQGHAALNKQQADEIKFRNTQFTDTLNHILTSWNYQDTNKGFFSKVYNGAYYLTCDINNFSIIGVYAYGFVTAACTWRIYGTTSNQEIYSATTNESSSWNELEDDDGGFDEFVTDVLQRSMAQFLISAPVDKCLHDKNATASVTEKWPAVVLKPTVKDTVTSLDDAVTAVVTVIVDGGHGSGCIISPDGYLLTNYHVISEDSSKTVKILMSNGDSLTANYVRSNSEYDLALLKLSKPGPYKCFMIDTAAKDIQLGEDIYAIGTPESILLGQTLTKGIISATRPAGNKTIIQTDVSINPGNSGGALVNINGHLVGIVNAKLAGIGIQGIGFAIPAYYIDDALKVKYLR